MPAAKPEIHKVYVETDEDHVAMQKHCTYVPDKVAHMPGRESTSTGEWMRLIKMVVISMLYNTYTEVLLLVQKNSHNMLTPSFLLISIDISRKIDIINVWIRLKFLKHYQMKPGSVLLSG